MTDEAADTTEDAALESPEAMLEALLVIWDASDSENDKHTSLSMQYQLVILMVVVGTMETRHAERQQESRIGKFHVSGQCVILQES